MATVFEWIRMGGIAMPILILVLVLFLPLAVRAVLFSFVATPNRERVRLFAWLSLLAGVLFVVVGAAGYASGAAEIREVIATNPVSDPEALLAAGLGEARIPLIAGLVLGAVALLTAGMFFSRARRLGSRPPRGTSSALAGS